MLLPYLVKYLVVQGGGEGMPAQEEGVREMSGEPRRSPGESEPNFDRRTEITQRTLLSEGQPTVQLASTLLTCAIYYYY